MSDFRFSNGIHGDGTYLPMPASLDELAGIILGDDRNRRPLGEDYANNEHFELIDDGDADDLAIAGWAVIFAQGLDPAIREALSPLLELRKRQATREFGGYKEFQGPSGEPREHTQEEYFKQLRMSPNGLVDPRLMPYYLLLVGGPEQISFEFQYQMDVARAVGRIHFETPEEYARYAESVVAAETRRRARRVSIFAARNGDDPSMPLALSQLVKPVADTLEDRRRDWTFERVLEEKASKARLGEILRDAPALLFTVGHGMVLPRGDARQVTDQGAIVCQEWPGPGAWNYVLPPEFYYAASDVPAELDLGGTILFQFACFSAGTPSADDYQGLGDLWIPAERPFVARLPQRLMSLPEGRGALAVIGHVDRIWTYSILNPETGVTENLVFEQALSRLLRGYRAGYAMELFNRWHAQYAVILQDLLFRERKKEPVDRKKIAMTWMISNDARNYILLGDPAVRLAE